MTDLIKKNAEFRHERNILYVAPKTRIETGSSKGKSCN